MFRRPLDIVGARWGVRVSSTAGRHYSLQLTLTSNGGRAKRLFNICKFCLWCAPHYQLPIQTSSARHVMAYRAILSLHALFQPCYPNFAIELLMWCQNDVFRNSCFLKTTSRQPMTCGQAGRAPGWVWLALTIYARVL